MKAVGIDLGTTYTLLSVIQDDARWWCVPNREGKLQTPSVVQLRPNEVVVGQIALETAHLFPNETVTEVKRSMGDPEWSWWANNKSYSAVDISSFVLEKVIRDSTERLGEAIRDVVLTVPAHFGDHQRKATLQAASQAGLEVLRLINEPTAAALAAGYDDLEDGDLLLVVDLGGGTFDVTALLWNQRNLEVIASRGEAYLGGQDWDDLLVHHAASLFISEHGADPLDYPESFRKLQTACRQAKHQLSLRSSLTIPVEHNQLQSNFQLSLSYFKKLSEDLLAQLSNHIAIMEEELHELLPPKRVQLVGGSTRMPMIRELLQQRYPDSVINHERPDTSVSLGAAYQAYLLQQSRETKTSFLIPKLFQSDESEIARLPGQTISQSQQEQTLLNLQDINNHTLGVVVLDSLGQEKVKSIVPAFSRLPSVFKYTFHTAYHNQVTLDIELVEGESPFPNDCLQVGKFVVENLPARPAGQPVNLTFNYDANGTLSIQVLDVGTGVLHSPTPE